MTLSAKAHGQLDSRLAWAGLAVFGVAALAFWLSILHQRKPIAEPVRFTVETPAGGSLPLFGRPMVSPDGKSVLFAVADTASHNPAWYVHSFDKKTSKALPGTETITAVYWSFDSRSVLLWRAGILWRMDLDTGSRQRLPILGAYSSWQPEGIVTGGQRGVRWFRPDGSESKWLKRRDDEHDIVYSYPSLVPGGRWLMYNATATDGDAAKFSIHLASFDGTIDREILTAEHPGIYTASGHLLYLRGDVLMAQAINPESGMLNDSATPVASSIGMTESATDRLGAFSASDNGVLVFRSRMSPANTDNSFTVITNWPSLLRKK